MSRILAAPLKSNSHAFMKSSFIPAFIAFGLMSYLAVVQQWSLQEFCWCVWLAGLFYSWTCVMTAAIQMMLTARAQKDYYHANIPLMKKIPPALFALGMIPVALLIGFVGLYLYTWLFSFYGLFLSVFAEMPPVDLFGRNGFINSDFFTPVTYLTDQYWPMILATLAANADGLLRTTPWKRIIFPFKQNEILRIHVMTLLMPFLAMMTWEFFRDAYQQLTIILLIGIFYLLPKRRFKQENMANNPLK